MSPCAEVRSSIVLGGNALHTRATRPSSSFNLSSKVAPPNRSCSPLPPAILDKHRNHIVRVLTSKHGICRVRDPQLMVYASRPLPADFHSLISCTICHDVVCAHARNECIQHAICTVQTASLIQTRTGTMVTQQEPLQIRTTERNKPLLVNTSGHTIRYETICITNPPYQKY